MRSVEKKVVVTAEYAEIAREPSRYAGRDLRQGAVSPVNIV